MRTDTEIRDIVFGLVKSSPLNDKIGGRIYTSKRPVDSDSEDIVIAVLANSLSEIQESYINVNIYVKDLKNKGINQEDTKRIRELSRIAMDCLKVFNNGYRITLAEQRTMEVESIGYHVINNRMLFRNYDEE